MLTIYVPQNVHPIIEYSEPYTYVTISIETHEQSLEHEKKYKVQGVSKPDFDEQNGQGI